MINGGLSALSSPSVLDPSKAYEGYQAHVMRSLTSWSVGMQHNAYRHYEWGGDLTSSIPQNPEETALLNVYLRLYQHLQNKLGQGETLKELARYLRPAEWGLDNVGAYRILRIGDREIFLPKRVYTGYEAGKVVWELAQLSDEQLKQKLGRVSSFFPYGYKLTALTNEELEQVNKDVFMGFQPDLHIDILVNW